VFRYFRENCFVHRVVVYRAFVRLIRDSTVFPWVARQNDTLRAIVNAFAIRSKTFAGIRVSREIPGKIRSVWWSYPQNSVTRADMMSVLINHRSNSIEL